MAPLKGIGSAVRYIIGGFRIMYIIIFLESSKLLGVFRIKYIIGWSIYTRRPLLLMCSDYSFSFSEVDGWL
jgi:hypothetical protein